MRIMIALGLLSATLLTGCPSPTDVCKSGVDQACERNFECQPAAVRASPQFQAGFGANVEECKTKLYANPGAPRGLSLPACEARTDQNQNCAFPEEAGKSFDLLAARDCKDSRASLTCEEYLAQQSDPTKAPARCAEKCK
jgi:hypothetical protein